MEREGGDITAADMLGPPMAPSKIQNFFSGTNVFITGATGFLGRLLVEKLLRTCPDINKIYALMRPKKGKTQQERLDEYFQNPLYDMFKKRYSATMQKLVVVSGDCALPNLGLSDEDEKVIVSEVNVVFHLAATVRFDEKIRTAAYINVRGTRDLLRLAKKVKDLRAMVYVSTAYSFCPQKTIDEVFYEPLITGDQLLTLTESLSDDMLETMVPTIKGDWPNTYAFTKSIAEDVVKKEGANLPLAIVRPSIVNATSKEPVVGWMNNFYGPLGVYVGVSLGVIRTMQCERNCISDMVPADYVVNAMIAAAWDVATTKRTHLNTEVKQETTGGGEEDITIYNYVSGSQNPVTWGEAIEMSDRHVQTVPPVGKIWHSMFWTVPNKYSYLFLHYLLHLLPAYIVDFMALCTGKPPQFVKQYKKAEKLLDVVSYFATRQWSFRNNNTQLLWGKLNKKDKRLFEFDISLIDWDAYYHSAIRGGRVYLVKDPLDTVAQGLSNQFRLKIAHYLLVGVLLLGLLKFMSLLRHFVF